MPTFFRSKPPVSFNLYMMFILTFLIILDWIFINDLLLFNFWFFVKIPFTLFFLIVTFSMFCQSFFYVQFDTTHNLVKFLTPFGWKKFNKSNLAEWNVFKVKGSNVRAGKSTQLFLECISKNGDRFIYPVYKEKDFDVLQKYESIWGPAKMIHDTRGGFISLWKTMGSSLLPYILMPRIT